MKFGFDKAPRQERGGMSAERLQMLDAKAREVIASRQFKMEDFRELYGDANIESDLAYVAKREGQFAENETRMYARVLEAIIAEQAGNWMGQEVEATVTSPYDDIANGVDMVARVNARRTNEMPQVLGLGIDATFTATGKGSVTDKLDAIVTKLRAGRLSQVKYYKDVSFTGSLSQVPLIVLGLEKHNLEQLASLWADGREEELSQHSVRYMFLEQAKAQLAAWVTLARKFHDKEQAQIMERAIAVPGQMIMQELKRHQIEAAKRNEPLIVPKDAITHAIHEYAAQYLPKRT